MHTMFAENQQTINTALLEQIKGFVAYKLVQSYK